MYVIHYIFHGGWSASNIYQQNQSQKTNINLTVQLILYHLLIWYLNALNCDNGNVSISKNQLYFSKESSLLLKFLSLF